jgi:hypothetical protein
MYQELFVEEQTHILDSYTKSLSVAKHSKL